MEKGYSLQVRLTQAEKRSFDDAAKASGTTTSSWVRDRLRRAAREELQSSGLKVPFLEPQVSV